MKHASISFVTLALFIMNFSVMAQTGYNINSNSSWSATIPATCSSCTITIGSNATLVIDESVTCQNCTFTGGAISIGGKTLNIQFSGARTTTNFNGTNLTVNGSGNIVANAPISLSNTIFTFNSNSTLTTSYSVSLSASTVYLNDNTSMTSNGGASTTIDLMADSRIVIGNGSKTSTAVFNVAGPTLTVYDNATVAVANQNNVFYNWADYYYQKKDNSSGKSAKAYSTSGLSMNCGAGYANACSNPSLYGPATLSSGVTSGATLPVILDGFTAGLNSSHTATLNWNTRVEVNFSHFTIQRSADGAAWEDIGTVQAMGNSAVQVDYSFTDAQPLAGANYYRLALVNLDDTYAYSEVKVVEQATIAKVSFFPNPARDFVNVSFGGEAMGQVTILLTSISGQLMQEKTAVAGSGAVVSFPIQNLSAGMYVLSVVRTDGSRESSPVMITR